MRPIALPNFLAFRNFPCVDGVRTHPLVSCIGHVDSGARRSQDTLKYRKSQKKSSSRAC
jgi:hypothetical protein